MSRVNFDDYFAEPQGLDMSDSFAQITAELNNMDTATNFNLENPGLMSSEFFDSILSLEEQQTASFENTIDFNDIPLCGDFTLKSGPEELHLNYNGSLDSADSNFSCETPDFLPSAKACMDFESNGKVILMKQPLHSPTKIFELPNEVAGKLIVNPNGKKVIVTKPYAAKNNRRNTINAKHVFKVRSISGTGKTLLLPFNVAQMKNFKVINAKGLSAENLHITGSTDVPLIKFEDSYSISSPDSIDDDSDPVDTKCAHQYPVLILTEEEKRLLAKEGICLPTHYPLTKNEEKDLKRIRRKIRNKISAQDSRKRRKEYVDGLEERLKQSAEEKKVLMDRVKMLQQQNCRLVSQMHKLQSMVFNTNKATPTTCLLIVLMSALLVSLPNLNITKDTNVLEEPQIVSRRTLLSSHRATNEDAGGLNEFLLFNANQKPKVATFEEESTSISEEQDTLSCLYYDEYEGSSKKLLATEDIMNDVRNTIEKMKAFFNNNLNIGNNYNEGKIMEKHEISKNFPKRVRLCSDMYDDYIPAKISKIEKDEESIALELNPDPDLPSSTALHLDNQE